MTRRNFRTVPLVGALSALALGLTACAANTGGTGGGDSGEDGDTSAGSLEVVSWWTSGSEADALQVLFDAVQAEMPGLQVENAAVSGGGGANAQQALNARLQGGRPAERLAAPPRRPAQQLRRGRTGR